MGLDLAASSIQFFLIACLELLFVILPLIIMRYRFKKNPKTELKNRLLVFPRSWWRRIFDILIGILIGFLFIPMGNQISQFTYQITVHFMGVEYYQQAVEGSVNVTPPSLSNFELFISILIMFLLVAFSEEFCFRGVIYREIAKKSIFLGVFSSSFFFALYHVFPGIVPIRTFFVFWPYYFTFGIVLALVTFIQKGDLLTALFAHGTFNSILFILQYT